MSSIPSERESTTETRTRCFQQHAVDPSGVIRVVSGAGLNELQRTAQDPAPPLNAPAVGPASSRLNSIRR